MHKAKTNFLKIPCSVLLKDPCPLTSFIRNWLGRKQTQNLLACHDPVWWLFDCFNIETAIKIAKDLCVNGGWGNWITKPILCTGNQILPIRIADRMLLIRWRVEYEALSYCIRKIEILYNIMSCCLYLLNLLMLSKMWPLIIPIIRPLCKAKALPWPQTSFVVMSLPCPSSSKKSPACLLTMRTKSYLFNMCCVLPPPLLWNSMTKHSPISIKVSYTLLLPEDRWKDAALRCCAFGLHPCCIFVPLLTSQSTVSR